MPGPTDELTRVVDGIQTFDAGMRTDTTGRSEATIVTGTMNGMAEMVDTAGALIDMSGQKVATMDPTAVRAA